MSHYTHADFNTIATDYTFKKNIPFYLLTRAFDFTNNDLAQALVQKRKLIKNHHLNSFEKKTGLAFEDFFEEKIEAELLRKRLLGDSLLLPDRYNFACFSRVRTTANLIEYLRFSRGWEYVEKLLAKYHVHTSFFDDLDREINFLFFSDIFNEITQGKIDNNLFRILAYSSILKNSDSWLGRLFAKTQSNEDLFQCFANNSASYDRNFLYNVKVESAYASISIKENPLVLEELKRTRIGSRSLCVYKQHFFSMLPLHRQSEVIDLKEVSCLYEGHSECRYDLQWNPINLKVIPKFQGV